MPHFRSPLPSAVAFFVIAVVFFGSISTAARARDITVFAAASLTNAIETAAATYEKETGDTIRLSLASSSTLARQIAAGAPADVFISANEKWMTWLTDQGPLVPGSRHDLLTNRLVIVAPKDSNLSPIKIGDTSDLTALIGPNDRIAVGDPDHVPAGIYAKQALTSLGQWETVAPMLARTDNVRAALALVERGEAPIGIVYQTDAGISDNVKIIGTFPENSHPVITYPVALTGDPSETKAMKFLLWLLGDDAGRIFADYGFEPVATTQANVPGK
ncbi:molybdenum ABC transporter substrate-binding protein [Thalassospira sp. MCCC 1A02803]|nr:molybdenum ABC transporter substrate-binding protein [Thalassospira sp. MCCC 1A02898]ONH88486.1 molybdenum ABC transporter substrate-binding protein [Thalassospira sp. MCCC 1A02803]